MTSSTLSRSPRSALASTPISSLRASTLPMSGRSPEPKASGSQVAASCRRGWTMVRRARLTTRKSWAVEATKPSASTQEADSMADRVTAALG